MKGTDIAMWEVDLHVYNTRKWLFRFLFDGQAFCKDTGYVCVRQRQLIESSRKAFHWEEKIKKLVIILCPTTYADLFTCSNWTCG